MRKAMGLVIALMLMTASATGCLSGRRTTKNPLPNPIYVRMSDASIGWAAAGGVTPGTAIVARTTDGGKTWLGTATEAEPVDLYGTRDGGATWSKVAGSDLSSQAPGGLPADGYKLGMTFIDESTGWLTGNNFAPGSAAMLFHVTHDGGRTWRRQQLELPDELKLNGVTVAPPIFIDGRRGVLTVNGSNLVYLYSTLDGGTTCRRLVRRHPAAANQCRRQRSRLLC